MSKGEMYEFSYDAPQVDTCNIYSESLGSGRRTYMEWYLETFGLHIMDPEHIQYSIIRGEDNGPVL